LESYEASFVQGKIHDARIVHRDYHTYQHYLYAVADEGPSSLQIIDLQYLPDSTPVVYDQSDLILRAHNIFIDTASAKLYQCGNTPRNSIRVFSLENPIAPVLIDEVLVSEASHDVYVHQDTAYINMGNSGLFIYDFSEIGNPQQIGLLNSYLDQGYNHSGWLDPERNLYLLADETHGKQMKLIDVEDVGNLEVLSLMHSNIADQSIPHNQILHGNIAYSAYYHDGFYAFDVSDPLNPEVFGFYDTSDEPNDNNYRGNWGVYPFFESQNIAISDMQEGLFVLRFLSPPVSVKQELDKSSLLLYPNPAYQLLNISSDMAITHLAIYNSLGRLVFASASGGFLETIDIQDFALGVYQVVLSTKETVSTHSFIKSR